MDVRENSEEAQRAKLVQPALPQPCSACPWRISNQGTPHPHGFYTKANIARLWNGIRRGDAPGMSCHPTDRRMAEFEGYERTADLETMHECCGSWVLITREVARFQAVVFQVEQEQQDGATFKAGEALRRYRELAGRGAMTREGLAEWVWRFTVVMPGQNPIAVGIDALHDPDIGNHLLPAWEPEIAARARRGTA